MQVEIDFTKSAQKNAEEQYGDAKKLEGKAIGAKKAIEELEGRLAESKTSLESKDGKRVEIRTRKKEWYEKFHWFFTSDSHLVIGGRDAKQNENLNSTYFEDKDLFFHADIFGAAVNIMKDGVSAGEDILSEVSQFAAIYSSAWKEGLKSVDVYSVGRDQVSKSTSKGSLGTGSFLISGERKWYRSVGLALVMFVSDGILNAVPASAFERIKANKKVGKHVYLAQGKLSKSDIAKLIAKRLDYQDVDEIIRELPAGNFSLD
jgi:predicted ribosome quality control (RQC) complex YloA/Tae2 family protein